MYIKKIYIKNIQIYLIAILTIANFILIKNIINSNNIINPNEINVSFIDVGQGDSILIQVNNKVMLIDSGPKSEKEKTFKYLDTLNLQTIDYVIATQSYTKRCVWATMAYIINKYKVEEFYSPKASSNTSAFENIIETYIEKLKDKYLKGWC